MANLKYKLVKRKLNFGAQKGKIVYVAQPVNLGKIGFEDFVKEMADGSTVDAADVKAVLSRLHTVISRLTERGFSVECGELGTFRPSFSSAAVEDEKKFNVSNSVLRKSSLRLSPRLRIRSVRQASNSSRRRKADFTCNYLKDV